MKSVSLPRSLCLLFLYTIEWYADWSLALSQFTLTRLPDGNYTFVLKKEKDGFPRTVYIHDDEGDLVGKDTQPPSAWTITGPDSKGLSTSVPIYLLL